MKKATTKRGKPVNLYLRDADSAKVRELTTFAALEVGDTSDSLIVRAALQWMNTSLSNSALAPRTSQSGIIVRFIRSALFPTTVQIRSGLAHLGRIRPARFWDRESSLPLSSASPVTSSNAVNLVRAVQRCGVKIDPLLEPVAQWANLRDRNRDRIP
jgi:hypothetical protein